MEKRIRFLLSRDDYYHQRGYWVLASALRDAGLEVILGGIQIPSEMVQTAIHEDVDIVGYRIMDAAPNILIPMLLDEMNQNGIPDIPVVVGGIIPKKDEVFIKELGVKAVFHPYSPLAMIIEQIQGIVIEARAKKKIESPAKE
jgi:methylmalonyl-CoA mutase cobalamin-binding domain/chain